MTAQSDERCLNCQASSEGPFCSWCGQAKSARLIPLRAWASDFIGAFVDLDSKLLKTLKRVFMQPGQATLDFAAGRRVPYSSPARVYIVVSAISIAAMTLRGAFSMDTSTVIPGSNADTDFHKRVQFIFPFVNLLSPFLTASFLAVFQRRQLYQLHLAFSFHFWTFLIAIATPLIFIPPTSIWSLVAFAGLSLISAGYLFVAHRRVYAMQLLNTLAVCGVLLLSVPLAAMLFTLLLFLLASIF